MRTLFIAILLVAAAFVIAPTEAQARCGGLRRLAGKLFSGRHERAGHRRAHRHGDHCANGHCQPATK